MIGLCLGLAHPGKGKNGHEHANGRKNKHNAFGRRKPQPQGNQIIHAMPPSIGLLPA